MLCLGRKVGQSIRIGEHIRIVLIRDGEGKTRLGIEAPRDMNIVRSELLESVATTSTGNDHASA